MFSTDQGLYLSGPLVSDKKDVDLALGSVLMDRYIIEGHLQKGSLSSIFLAKDTMRNIPVALKIVEQKPGNNSVAVLHFKREVFIRNRLSEYSSVVQAYDIHQTPWGGSELLIISCEYSDGGSFRDWLKTTGKDTQTRLTEGIEYFKQMCQCVGRLHDKNIIHLDVKPDNFLFINGRLKIADLGSAIAFPIQQEFTDLLNKMPLNKTGTTAYMSPEHLTAIDPDHINHKTDIYALGITLFELTHPQGQVPFTGTDERIINLHLHGTLSPTMSIDNKIFQVIHNCLKKDRNDRYQTTDELLEDLERDPEKDNCFDNANYTNESWQQISTCFSEGSFNEAYMFLDQFLEENPNHLQALQLKDELTERYNRAEQFYKELDADMETGELPELISYFSQTEQLYPNHPSGENIKNRLTSRASQFRQAMEKGLVALKNENWENALNLLENALQLNSAVIDIKPLIDQLAYITEIRQQINQSLLQNNQQEARRCAGLVDYHVDEIRQLVPALREHEVTDDL